MTHGYNVSILRRDCPKSDALDTSLPRDAYLITYLIDDEKHYDITRGRQVDLFDYYWDHYRENFIGWEWAEGKVNPKLYGTQQKQQEKKKR